MTLDEIILKIEEDGQIPSRWPTRLIFTESLLAYNDLVSRLNHMPEASVMLNLADYCAGPDKLPVKSRLDAEVNALGEKRIIILSFSEYLRVALGKESTPQRLFRPYWEKQQSESSKCRIIIPLFSCKELFEKIVPIINQRQTDFIYHLEGQPKRYDVFFCSPRFEMICKGATQGLQNWFREWNSLLREQKECKIITSFCDRIEKSATSVYVDVQSDVFEFLQKNAADTHLKKSWGCDEQWAVLANAHKFNLSLTETIDKQLNVSHFDPLRILALWNAMTNDQKWLAWLRFKFHNDSGYISYVLKKTEGVDGVGRELKLSIFHVLDDHPEWATEYRNAMTALKSSGTEADVLAGLDSIPDISVRLSLLTGESHAQKTYCVKLASQMLREGETLNEVSHKIENIYPDFAYYLRAAQTLPSSLRVYFAWYVQKKVENVFARDDNLLQTVNLDKHDSRYDIISQYPKEDMFLWWFDGMGVEWLPLFLYSLEKESMEFTFTHKVTAARLPTETDYNEQWKEYKPHADKRDKLDKLAHNGMPDDNDYFSCIATQIEIIQEFATLAVRKLKDYNTVIVSADHGSSRIAARAFHEEAGITAPSGATVGGHGRYCEFSAVPNTSNMPTCVVCEPRDSQHFYVMASHDHFVQKGKAVVGAHSTEVVGCGEIHGGKTPEEYLVPVIVLKRKIPLKPKTTAAGRKSGISKNTAGDL
ncbi:MAG: BREX-4 system phosphatase PglZ [Phycisphaerales bacterium]